MKFIRSILSRGRIVKVSLVILIFFAAILFSIRTIYALSIFGGLNRALESAGWQVADDDFMMQPREEMTFEASYLLFKIGSVRFQVLGKADFNKVPAYRLRAFIDSYSGIPFVNLHAVFETYADAKTFYCLSTSNSQKQGDNWVYTRYDFDYERKAIEREQSENGKVINRLDYPLDKGYTDGLSFFYYLREASKRADGKKTFLYIPIVVDTVLSSVEMTINEGHESCNVTAFDFPLDANRMSGHINFKGFFGVTGDFTGWMSTDSSQVPLKADVKVILGSVVVKLKDIKRSNWSPVRSGE